MVGWQRRNVLKTKLKPGVRVQSGRSGEKYQRDYPLAGAADVVVNVILKGLESRDAHGSQ